MQYGPKEAQPPLGFSLVYCPPFLGGPEGGRGQGIYLKSPDYSVHRIRSMGKTPNHLLRGA